VRTTEAVTEETTAGGTATAVAAAAEAAAGGRIQPSAAPRLPRGARRELRQDLATAVAKKAAAAAADGRLTRNVALRLLHGARQPRKGSAARHRVTEATTDSSAGCIIVRPRELKGGLSAPLIALP